MSKQPRVQCPLLLQFYFRKTVSFAKNQKNRKNVSIKAIIEDIWIDCFCYLSIHDFCCVRQTCKQFHSLTKPSIPRMNKFWQMKSYALCSDIESNYETKNWYSFYNELRNFLVKIDSNTIPKIKINAKKHKIVSPKLPVSLGISTNDAAWRHAIATDSLQLFQMLVCGNNSSNFDINHKDDRNVTALHLCCEFAKRKKHCKILDYLLSLPVKLDIHATRTGFLTPLMVAVRANDAETTKKLLKHQNMTQAIIDDVSAPGGFSCLHQACGSEGSYEIAKLLIKNGANINIKSSKGQTPLQIACQTFSKDCVRLLLSAGADINITDVGNRTALFHACNVSSRNDADAFVLVRMLLTSKKTDGNDKNDINSNSYEHIFEMDQFGLSAFMLAALRGHLSVVKYIYKHLLELESNKMITMNEIRRFINAQEAVSGMSAYLCACIKHRADVALFFVENISVCDFEICDRHGRNATELMAKG